jgi:hypothetical protein
MESVTSTKATNLLQQSGEGNEKSHLKWNELGFKQTKRYDTVPFKSNRRI